MRADARSKPPEARASHFARVRQRSPRRSRRRLRRARSSGGRCGDAVPVSDAHIRGNDSACASRLCAAAAAPTLVSSTSAVPPGRRFAGLCRYHADLVLAALLLLGLAFLVLGSHVRRGGFYSDDWSRASEFRFEGYAQLAFEEWRHAIPGRPVLALLTPLPHALFGVDSARHLAAALVLSAMASTAFFAFLRTLGVRFPHALAMSLLSLVFPWSDAVRLWPTGSLNNVALIAYFLGTVLALRALELRQSSRRRTFLLHGMATALYLVSVLTYEVAAAAILGSGVLYLSRVSWHTARSRWILDAALVLVTLSVSLVMTGRVRPVGSPGQRVMDFPRFVANDLSIIGSALLPSRAESASTKLLVVTAATAVVAAALVRARRRQGSELRGWLRLFATGVAGVAVGHVMFLGSGLFPNYSGIDDRVNTFAAFGFVMATYSLLALLGLLLAGRARRAPLAILAAGALLVGLSWVQRVRADAAHYDKAVVLQTDALTRLRRALPAPKPGTTILTFGYPATSAPGVPIFSHVWDLTGAVRLEWNDPSLDAQPVYRLGVVCADSGVYSAGLREARPAPYGDAVFVDLRTLRTIHIGSRRDCLRARRHFQPGPLVNTAT
jgi:hypothetical protein